MQFTTIHFLFLFFPIFFLVFNAVKSQNWRNFVLVTGSLFFFAWGDLTHLPILIISLLINYFMGLLLKSVIKSQKSHLLKGLRTTGILLNLGLLFFFKYIGFFASFLQQFVPRLVFGEAPGLPLGISFFTFTGISYLVDVYQRRLEPEKNIIAFAAFFTLFPKLLQGPLVTYGSYTKNIAAPTLNWSHFADGIRRFIQGLAKKVLIADALGVAVEEVFSTHPALLGAGPAWFGLICFALQIFFDFSGYTDMAIGLGQLLGIKLPENFDDPYMSRSITEFWRRWHMTLTHWFRTYVFFPLEFKRRKIKHFRQPTNILIVFLLTGLWHGADWNFVIWGAYFGIILVAESMGGEKVLKKAPIIIQHLYSVMLILVGWLIFKVDNINEWWEFCKVLFGSNGSHSFESLRSLNILFYFPHLIIGLILSTPLLKCVIGKIHKSSLWWQISESLILVLLLFLSISKIILNGFLPFIYEQF